jgi:hypothetical protein
MDPNENIREQRELAARVLANDDYFKQAQFNADANRLAELVQALDEWRTRGGFDPYTA